MCAYSSVQHDKSRVGKEFTPDLHLTNIGEFRVPYSQRYSFNAIPDTNHNANLTNPNRNSKDNPNPNTRFRCEYVTLNSMFAPHLTQKTIHRIDSSGVHLELS